jgi:hypothetical protein
MNQGLASRSRGMEIASKIGPVIRKAERGSLAEAEGAACAWATCGVLNPAGQAGQWIQPGPVGRQRSCSQRLK